MKMAGTHTPGLGKADQNKLSSNAVSFGRCLLSTYSVPVSLRYTSLMLFHFSVQPAPRSGYHYLSLTNEQVGRPGRLNGFPQGIAFMLGQRAESKLESKVGALLCCSFESMAHVWQPPCVT